MLSMDAKQSDVSSCKRRHVSDKHDLNRVVLTV